MSSERDAKDGMEPDGMKRWSPEPADVNATGDELDAEGHKRFVRATEDEGAEDPVGGQQPGDPDSSRFSDRNLKVHVVPVTW